MQQPLNAVTAVFVRHIWRLFRWQLGSESSGIVAFTCSRKFFKQPLHVVVREITKKLLDSLRSKIASPISDVHRTLSKIWQYLRTHHQSSQPGSGDASVTSIVSEVIDNFLFWQECVPSTMLIATYTPCFQTQWQLYFQPSWDQQWISDFFLDWPPACLKLLCN